MIAGAYPCRVFDKAGLLQDLQLNLRRFPSGGGFPPGSKAAAKPDTKG